MAIATTRKKKALPTVPLESVAPTGSTAVVPGLGQVVPKQTTALDELMQPDAAVAPPVPPPVPSPVTQPVAQAKPAVQATAAGVGPDVPQVTTPSQGGIDDTSFRDVNGSAVPVGYEWYVPQSGTTTGPVARDKDTGEIIPGSATGQFRIYTAPEFLDAEAKAMWNAINDRVRQALETIDQQGGFKADRRGELNDPETPLGRLQAFVSELQQNQQHLIGTSNATASPAAPTADIGGMSPEQEQARAEMEARQGELQQGGTGPAQTALDELMQGDSGPTDQGGFGPTGGGAETPGGVPTADGGTTAGGTTPPAVGATTPGGPAGNISGDAVDPETGGLNQATKDEAWKRFTDANVPGSKAQEYGNILNELDAAIKAGDQAKIAELSGRMDAIVGADDPTSSFLNKLIESSPGAGEGGGIIDNFLESMIAGAGEGEISDEEKQVIRQEFAQAAQQALSSMSARGLGRGSEALIAKIQAELGATARIAQRNEAVRKENLEAGFKAAQVFLDKTSADRNYQLALKDQNLAEVKNAQGFSLEQRRQQFLEETTKAGQALDEKKFEEAKRQFEKEFGLAFDAEKFKQFIETGRLEMDAINQDETNRLRELDIVNRFILDSDAQKLERDLGIANLDLQRWVAGENIGIEKMKTAITRIATLAGLELEEQKLDLMLRSLEQEGDVSLGDIMNLGIGAVKLFMTLGSGGGGGGAQIWQ